MTRGRHHNDAYITIAGEQIAVDVFADAIGRSWIDQPALARQVELTGANSARPGALSPEYLRSLFEQRAQLTKKLARLDADLAQLPYDLDRADLWLASSKGDLKNAREQLQEALDTIAEHDRPFRRRGHENVIARAHQIGRASCRERV